MLRQGGNWIGSTDYSFGDKLTVGYGERLALLFTEAIGRQISDDKGYIGAGVGESLVRAKQRYLTALGPQGLSIYDEKVLLGMTFYGLPFIRVRVPNPTLPPFDPQPRAIPDDMQSDLEEAEGVFTRLITLTTSFPLSSSVAAGADPYAVSTTVEDSFAPGEPVEISLAVTNTGKVPSSPAWADLFNTRDRAPTS